LDIGPNDTAITLSNAAAFSNAQYHLMVTDGVNVEVMMATALAGDVLSVVRGAELWNGSAESYAFGSGATVKIVTSLQSVLNLITQSVATETARAEGAEATNATAISTETTRAEAAEALKLPLAGGAVAGALVVEYGSTIGNIAFEVKDASGDNLIAVQKGAASGAAYGSLIIPGGDILNVVNIQGGFTGVTFNLNIAAGGSTSGTWGNVELNFGNGLGTDMWNGGTTAFVSDASPGSLIAKFNRTTNNTTGEGTIKFYLPFYVFDPVAITDTASEAFTVANASSVINFNVNTTSGFVEVPNNTVLRVYSDSFTTVKFQAYNGYLVVANGMNAGAFGAAINTTNFLWGPASGAPASGNGANGDYYLRSDGSSATTHIYFKASGAWTGIA
jgi:hypothetical protein